MKAPDTKAGTINLIFLSVIALVLLGLMFRSFMMGDYDGATIYMGFLFINFGLALYTFRVAVFDGTGYKEVKE
ncbi:hypothetical protein [Heliorestis convoluta]|uniref:Putative membrane protein, PetL n=1 Tax=Heliorestis convoluta TaxID=356322 RepID=A0A5Q2N485_9FIRM|nr:hypothetical protein [Heliorestis convoluta]QGG48723.1 putative membrane protein, PetL [Heliorestis convoluta]